MQGSTVELLDGGIYIDGERVPGDILGTPDIVLSRGDDINYI